ncbi:MAG TPA: carboxylating nicotinate-nucleotide diphosphorylase [Phycisphaerae bacterium]|nr:carboxylating nicotinate-nucleotide diphosphorylase [Phycisphaerae bacterium]HNU45214.1 carboxylating nicotinate-nucleotide diphosphorylase [Phycisphaerae bacterium]
MDIAEEKSVLRLIELAREEDLGSGDLSSSLLPAPELPATFRLIAQEPGVLAGQRIALSVLRAYDPTIQLEWLEGVQDGLAWDDTPRALASIRGPLGVVLSAERVLLNFLQRLSGIATLTRRYVEAVAGTGAAILDTRKTTPGWRLLEKYAVRCGGGHNHRFGLYDAVLIKDNHLAGIPLNRLAGAVFEMLNHLSSTGVRPAFVEVEADAPEQAEELFKVVGVDVILLDNFALEDVVRIVQRRGDLGLQGKIDLEASGGVDLRTVRALAEAGVERISVGALTHAARGLNLSLERD